MYDLYAVSNHFGSLNGGHYTATCKSSVDNGWYYYNDSSVSSAGNAKIMKDAAYVLFYRRRDDPSTDKSNVSDKSESTKASSELSKENSQTKILPSS